MIKIEHKYFYDVYGTSNYTENKDATFAVDVSETQIEKYINILLAICPVHYETSKAHFFEKAINANNYEQYIIYK